MAEPLAHAPSLPFHRLSAFEPAPNSPNARPHSQLASTTRQPSYRHAPPVLKSAALPQLARVPVRPLYLSPFKPPTAQAQSNAHQPRHRVETLSEEVSGSARSTQVQSHQQVDNKSKLPALAAGLREHPSDHGDDEKGESVAGGPDDAASDLDFVEDEWADTEEDSEADDAEHEMEVSDTEDEDSRDRDEAAGRYRPFTFRDPFFTRGGYDWTVPLGPSTGPLTADEVPASAGGTSGATLLVKTLLRRNQDLGSFNNLPTPTTSNAQRYESVSSTLAIPFVSPSVSVQPPRPTRLNNDLANGKLAFLAFFTYSLSAFGKTKEDGEAWLSHLRRRAVRRRARGFGLGVYLKAFVRGLERFRDLGGWDGEKIRYLEYIGRASGWDRYVRDKKRHLRPLAHILGPLAKPKSLCQFVLQELAQFQELHPTRPVERFLSFGGTAADLDRSTPEALVQEVEALAITGRFTPVTYGGLNIAPGGNANRNELVLDVLRNRPARDALELNEDGTSKIDGASPAQVIMASQALARAQSIDGALRHLEENVKAAAAGGSSPKELPKSGIVGPKFAKSDTDAAKAKDSGSSSTRPHASLSSASSSSSSSARSGRTPADTQQPATPARVRSRADALNERAYRVLNPAKQTIAAPFATHPGFLALCEGIRLPASNFEDYVVCTREVAIAGAEVPVKYVTKKNPNSTTYMVVAHLLVLTDTEMAICGIKTTITAKTNSVHMRWDPRKRKLIFTDPTTGQPIYRPGKRGMDLNGVFEWRFDIDEICAAAELYASSTKRVHETDREYAARKAMLSATRKRVLRRVFC